MSEIDVSEGTIAKIDVLNDDVSVHEGGKFLTFFFDEEEYAIEILKVQEIIGVMPITAVPRTPSYLLGVINLRGKVIPVIDLRARFGMEAVDWTDETCIIVMQIAETQMGMMVDKVSEVLDIAAEAIEDTPSFGAGVNTDYIMGIGKAEGKVRLLLDIDRVISIRGADEMSLAAQCGE